jgi:hypothetical protein
MNGLPDLAFLQRERDKRGRRRASTSHPDHRWMAQVARNVTDLEEGFFRGKRYLILDRDTKYSDEYKAGEHALRHTGDGGGRDLTYRAHRRMRFIVNI